MVIVMTQPIKRSVIGTGVIAATTTMTNGMNIAMNVNAMRMEATRQL